MAILKGPFNFEGSLGGFRSSWDKDLKKQVLSTKKTGNSNIIKNNPKQWQIKALNNEWAGCCIWSKIIRLKTEELVYLKNGRQNGKLTGIAKFIQEMDTTCVLGHRRIESSKSKDLLVGFSMNNAHPFKDVLHVKPEVSISEDRRVVTLKLNNFRSSSKFKWPEVVQCYRLYLTIFELPDIEWDEFTVKFRPKYPVASLATVTAVSEWIGVRTTLTDVQIAAAFPEGYQPREGITVVAVMGVELSSGTIHDTQMIVKDHGTMVIVDCF